jgi:hypothetical protein
MAHAAGVPRAWLIEFFAQSSGSLPIAESLAVAAGSARSQAGGLLARNLPADVIVRRCRPDHGFVSIELCQPWQSAPLAGVNEAGISVITISEGNEVNSVGCAAPAALLAQDCLRRVDHLDAAVEWLMTRPGAGRSTLLIADSMGEVVAVHAAGKDRRLSRPAAGLIVHNGGPDRDDGIEKALREFPQLTASNFAQVFGTPMVVVEAASRSILVRGMSSAKHAVRIGVCA